MSYESKIIIANRFRTHEDKNGMHDSEIIAELNLSVMPDEFTKLFTKESDVYIYPDGDTPTNCDMYGEKLKEASIESVIDWLVKQKTGKTYKHNRSELFLSALLSIKENYWNDYDIRIIHYGY